MMHEDEVSAYHEAGHAIIACYYGVEIQYVTIEWSWLNADANLTDTIPVSEMRDPEVRGHVGFKERYEVRLRRFDWITLEGRLKGLGAALNEAVIYAASTASVERSGFVPMQDYYSGDEREMCAIHKGYRFGYGCTFEQFRCIALSEARTVLRIPYVWKAVKETADALLTARMLETLPLSGDEVKAIYDKCKAEAGA